MIATKIWANRKQSRSVCRIVDQSPKAKSRPIARYRQSPNGLGVEFRTPTATPIVTATMPMPISHAVRVWSCVRRDESRAMAPM